jgi:hypothetical protein
MLFRTILVISVMLLINQTVFAGEKSLMFTKNPDVAKVAEAYSLDCVDWVKTHTKIELDWTDESIQHIEGILDQLSVMAAKDSPPKERIQDFSKMFGFYLGEVYRKNHGGVEWGDVLINGNKYYGLGLIETKEAFIWPTVRINKRIVLGAEENVWVYYQAITRK